MKYLSKKTRFRAYQLGTEGSSFSYFDGENFTLIEARLTEQSAPSLIEELKICGFKEGDRIHRLHITSWDTDHCSPKALNQIIEALNPKKIEYPGYAPHTDSGKESLKIIKAHTNSVSINSKYVKSLNPAPTWGYSNILYNNKKDYPNSNNNSSVKFFRSGSFTVLSLGDLEKEEIADYLTRGEIIKNEVDVLILAHHGADNGFTTEKFIQAVSPKVAICSSNFANQYTHPRQEIRDILYQNDVTLYTTKTGDIIIESQEDDTVIYKASNLKANSTEISSEKNFNTKRWDKWGAEGRPDGFLERIFG